MKQKNFSNSSSTNNTKHNTPPEFTKKIKKKSYSRFSKTFKNKTIAPLKRITKLETLTATKKTIKQKPTNAPSSEDMMHTFMESLNDKVTQIQSMINKIEITPSSNMTNEFNRLFSECDIRNPIDLARANFNSCQNPCQQSSMTSTSSQIPLTAPTLSTISSISGRRTAYDYAPAAKTTYTYGFTNSEFFNFIASLDPVEYILVITVISILIAISLTVFERQLVGGALVDIGVTIGNLLEQELFQKARQGEVATQKRNQAEQTDFNTLYNSIDQLKAELNSLKEQLGDTASDTISSTTTIVAGNSITTNLTTICSITTI